MSIQQTIIKGIKEQLFFNNYLVLPNFGGFVLKSNPSHYSASGGLLIPPSKTVSFNSQLKQNDGILAIWLQNTLKCHANEAITHLNDFSEFCSGVLNAKRRLSLEGIGFFYLDFENNICFEPQQDSNFLTKSFGLAPVSIKELEPEISEMKKETVFVDRTLHTAEPAVQPIRTKKNYSKMVTPLLIAILFVSLLGLLVNNSSMQGELRASLFGGDPHGSYAPVNYPELDIVGDPGKSPAYVADANGIATIELEESKKIAVKAVESTISSSIINHSLSDHKPNLRSGKFEIVLGCFAVLENANKMVKKLNSQRIKAAVAGKNTKGMYVVSSASFSTKDEAIGGLLQVKDNFPHAWIWKSE